LRDSKAPLKAKLDRPDRQPLFSSSNSKPWTPRHGIVHRYHIDYIHKPKEEKKKKSEAEQTVSGNSLKSKQLSKVLFKKRLALFGMVTW